MWTPNVKRIYPSDTAGIVNIVIEYSKGNEIKTVDDRISDPSIESIKQLARNAITEFDRLDQIKELLETPPLGVLDISLPVGEDTLKDNFPA
jgi:hypothetical protein